MKPGVGLTVKVAGLRSLDLEFECLSAAESGGIDLACHPEVSEMSTSVLVMEGIASAAQQLPQKMMLPAITRRT